MKKLLSVTTLIAVLASLWFIGRSNADLGDVSEGLDPISAETGGEVIVAGMADTDPQEAEVVTGTVDTDPLEAEVVAGTGGNDPLVVTGGTDTDAVAAAITPWPTDADPKRELRSEAEAFAQEDPAAWAASDLPQIVSYLKASDPYVRQMGAVAVAGIGVSPEANASGLRSAAQDDAALRAALFDTVSYEQEGSLDEDDQARQTAVEALGWLYADAPDSTIEQAWVSRYWDEYSLPVRRNLVEGLCWHGYTSQGVRDVFTDAAQDYDDALAAKAKECLDGLP